jgi:hypothetical protein
MEQVADAVLYLETSEWVIKIHTNGESTCIVFANSNNIQTLTYCSYLTLLDLTYNMNKLKWYSSTLIPIAFSLHNNMDSDIIVVALI